MKSIYKYIICAVIIIVLSLIIFFVYKNQANKNMYTGAGQWFVNFNSNYVIPLPKDYVANANTSPGSTIVIDKNALLSYPNIYDEILLKGGIVIQSFIPFDKDDAIFEKYIKENYIKQLEQAGRKIDVDFKDVNANKVANIKISNDGGELMQVIKIINFTNPVIIAAANESDQFKEVFDSIKPLKNDEYIENIKNKIVFIGTLIKAQYIDNLYDQFSASGKEKISKDDLNKMFSESQKNITYPITLYGGKFENNAKKFSCNLVFASPDNKSLITGQLVLEKEKDNWSISDLKIPADAK